MRDLDLPCWHRKLAPIVIKAAPGFATVPSGFDIFDQKRAGAIFAVRQAVVKDRHNRDAGVETDEIGKFKRPHGVVGPQAQRVPQSVGQSCGASGFGGGFQAGVPVLKLGAEGAVKGKHPPRAVAVPY